MSLVFVFLLFLNSACQDGWIGHGTSCYKLFNSSKTWENAKTKCKQRNASLVKVESSAENDFIKTTLLPTKSDDYWIGLSDSNKEGDWLWTDGTQLGLDGYKNWGGKQPNDKNNNQNCVVIRIRKSDSHHYGKWHDLQCSHRKQYICEKRHVDSF